MKFHTYLLPALALGAAALLVGPAEQSYGFSKIGGALGLNQRDFRIRNNFLDASANNNNTEEAFWPGYTGVFLAVWKGHAEWNSRPHGPNAALGTGNANFDSFMGGEASGIGTTNDNIVSALPAGCSAGVLAFTETPITNGWRIRFCEGWTWSDGPGSGNGIDIQGVATHEYGHALGLGHSNVSGATMFPSISGSGTGARTIAADDRAGVQCIYGVRAVNKPEVTGTQGVAGTANIAGNFFSPTDNEVWFTPAGVTAPGTDPRIIVTGVSSANGLISIPIPAGAGDGDLIVKIPGGTTGRELSNTYPFDLDAVIGDVPGAPVCYPNSTVPAEFVGDPILTDIGGDPTMGPKINDAVEVFNLGLNCAGMSSTGIYSMVLRAGAATTPIPSNFGLLYNSGPVLLKVSGPHFQNGVFSGPTTLPNDINFVGLEYTAQGFCSQTGGGRLSGGLIQTVGG